MRFIFEYLSETFIKFEDRNKTFIGYFWSLLASCLLSTSSFYVKKGPDEIPSSEILFYRSIQLSVYTYIFMYFQRSEFHFRGSGINRLLIIRALAGIISVMLSYYGLKLVPLSDAVVIMQTYPVPTGLFAAVLLKERYEPIQFWTALACIIGVGLIAQPEFIFGSPRQGTEVNNDERILGVIVLVLSSIFNALAQVLVRKAGTKTNVGIVALYYSHGSAALSALVCIFQGFKAFGIYAMIQMFLVAVPIFIAQLIRNRAYVLVKAGRVSVVAYFGILHAYLLDIFVLGTDINLLSLLGGFCIFSCMFFYMYEMYRKEQRE